MEHLLIVEANITDPSWIKEYLEKVTPLVLAHGGSYITRSSAIELLEGDGKPQYCLVARFPSKEAALTFYNSDEYGPFKAARQKGSTSRFLLVAVENGVA